jgi:hypothetical protein
MKKILFVLFVLVILFVSACGAINEPIGSQAPAATPVPTESAAPIPQASPIPTFTPMPQATLATTEFPLKGLRFPAYANGQLNTSYDLFVEANGRLWEKWLPSTGKVAHSVAFELPAGDYVFNGVVARLYLDVDHNGKGSSNPMTVGNGNDLRFTVTLPEGTSTAWVLVESDGGAPSGFDIWFLDQ